METAGTESVRADAYALPPAQALRRQLSEALPALRLEETRDSWWLWDQSDGVWPDAVAHATRLPGARRRHASGPRSERRPDAAWTTTATTTETPPLSGTPHPKYHRSPQYRPAAAR